jgi:hypothetical protein
MIRLGKPCGQLFGVITQRTGDERDTALQDDPLRFPPRVGQASQRLETKLGEAGAALGVAGDQIAARLHEVQLPLQLG